MLKSEVLLTCSTNFLIFCIFTGKIPIDPVFAASVKDRSTKKEINFTDSLKIFQEISQEIVHKLKINE